MKQRRCFRFAWINPKEDLPDISKKTVTKGAFAYTFENRVLDCYFPITSQEEEEEGLFKADAVNEEDPERDRATPA